MTAGNSGEPTAGIGSDQEPSSTPLAALSKRIAASFLSALFGLPDSAPIQREARVGSRFTRGRQAHAFALICPDALGALGAKQGTEIRARKGARRRCRQSHCERKPASSLAFSDWYHSVTPKVTPTARRRSPESGTR